MKLITHQVVQEEYLGCGTWLEDEDLTKTNIFINNDDSMTIRAYNKYQLY